MSACTNCGEMPGLRRARIDTVKIGREGVMGLSVDSSSCKGIQTCVPRGKSKPCGMTPTTVRERRSRAMSVPTIFGSPPRRLCQKA